MEEQEKKTVIYDSCGPTGNIFWIMGAVQDVLESEDRETEFKQIFIRVTESDSYETALKVIGEYVNLVDDNQKNMEM